MKKYNNSLDLAEAIAELELKASLQKKDIQESFNVLSENLKPVNLIKNGVRSVFDGGNKEDLLKAIVGLGSGILSRKLILGNAKGFIGKNIGRAVQWGIAGLVSKNAEKIKDKAGIWIDKYLKKSKSKSSHMPAPPSLPLPNYSVKN